MGGEFDNLHQILRSLYEEMMPLCSDMTSVAKGLAGLGALLYVAIRCCALSQSVSASCSFLRLSWGR